VILKINQRIKESQNAYFYDQSIIGTKRVKWVKLCLENFGGPKEAHLNLYRASCTIIA
jgi:hypothetical protein